MPAASVLSRAIAVLEHLRATMSPQHFAWLLHVPHRGSARVACGTRRIDYEPGRLVTRQASSREEGDAVAPAAALSTLMGRVAAERSCVFIVSPDLGRSVGDPTCPLASILVPEIELEVSPDDVRLCVGSVSAPEPVALADVAAAERPPLRFAAHPAPSSWQGESDQSFARRLSHAIEEVRRTRGKAIVARAYSREQPAGTDPLALFEMYAGREANAAAAHYIEVPGAYVSMGCSPENIFERSGRRLDLDVVAATRPISEDEREDQHLAQELISDPKERREHQLAIDRARSFLAGVCPVATVQPVFERAVRRMHRVRHLHSRLTGELPDGFPASRLVERVFPPLASYPPELARRVESMAAPFRFYGGIVAHADGGGRELDCYLNLRALTICGGRMHTVGGVGVVEGSKVELEQNEVVNKLRSLREAVDAWLADAR